MTHGWIDKIAMDVGYRKGFRQQAEWWENGAEYKYQQNPHSLLQAPGPHTAHLRKYTNQPLDCSFRKTELQTSLCRLIRSFRIKICTILLELKQIFLEDNLRSTLEQGTILINFPSLVKFF